MESLVGRIPIPLTESKAKETVGRGNGKRPGLEKKARPPLGAWHEAVRHLRRCSPAQLAGLRGPLLLPSVRSRARAAGKGTSQHPAQATAFGSWPPRGTSSHQVGDPHAQQWHGPETFAESCAGAGGKGAERGDTFSTALFHRSRGMRNLVYEGRRRSAGLGCGTGKFTYGGF